MSRTIMQLEYELACQRQSMLRLQARMGELQQTLMDEKKKTHELEVENYALRGLINTLADTMKKTAEAVQMKPWWGK